MSKLSVKVTNFAKALDRLSYIGEFEKLLSELQK
jgi:hypothetical protein